MTASSSKNRFHNYLITNDYPPGGISLGRKMANNNRYSNFESGVSHFVDSSGERFVIHY
jgi:hypothetical protein